MHYERPTVLSIAGFDPSGGAGVLADIKTLEQHRCLGLGVLTAVTIQTEDHFLGIDWLSLTKIKEQLLPLLEQYPVSVIKIGIVESLQVLQHLLHFIKKYKQEIRIIWDPVIASTSGFTFHKTIDRSLLAEILSGIFLLTPNIPEAGLLAGVANSEDAAEWLSSMTNILLKGGHNETQKGIDHLWESGKKTTFVNYIKAIKGKHGSGCILSSAIAANLALGKNLQEATQTAKKYIEQILNSNSNLLAYHA